jgi:hypothetical protein
MSEEKQVQGRVKDDNRRGSLVLLSGITFTKSTWTTIPKEKVEEARKELSDILTFRETGAETPPVEVDPMSEAQQQLQDRENEELVRAEKARTLFPETPENSEEEKQASTSSEKKPSSPKRSRKKEAEE